MRYCAGPNTTKGGACACCARTRCSYKHFAGAAFESEKAARVLLWCAMRCAHMQTRPLRRIHTQNTRAHPDTVYLPACMHADQIPACTACCACCAVPVRIAGHMTCACTHAIAHAVANASCKSRVRHSTACVAACVTACATCCNTCLAALFPPLNLQSCLDLLPCVGVPALLCCHGQELGMCALAGVPLLVRASVRYSMHRNLLFTGLQSMRASRASQTCSSKEKRTFAV